MRLNKMSTFWSIMAVIAIFSYGCPKNCVDATYSFSAPAQYTPDKDSIHVGDTIFLSSSFPTQVKDQFTGQTIDYSGLKNSIGATLGIGEFIENEQFLRDAVFDFDYINIKGQIFNARDIPKPDGVQQVRYEESDGLYQLKFGIIAKKKGVYAFGLGNGLGVTKNCTRAQVNISIANTNQHLYYPYLFKPDWQSNDYEKQHTYYFKVH